MQQSTTTRLSLAIGLAVFVTLSFFGVVQYRREVLDLRTVAERELRVLGIVVEIAATNALRDDQWVDVRETLDSLQRIDPSLRVGVVDPQGAPLAVGRSAPSLPSGLEDGTVREWQVALPALLEESRASGRPVMRSLGASGRGALLLVQPLRADDASVPLGALVVTRSLRDLGRDVRLTGLTLLLSLLSAALAVFFIGRIAGRRFVTAPLDTLGAAMRDVRSGDGSVRVTARHDGEIGLLIGEFNAMVAAVAEARRQLEEEVEARQALERGLQHVDKLVAIGQLSSGLAHEIGSPLQVLQARAVALRDAPQEPDEVQRQAAILVTQTERIIRIVRQLLAFGRRLPQTVALHDVRTVVGTMVEFIEPAARRRGVTVTFEHDDVLPPVALDADRIQQVVLNLLTNAVRATGSGGRVHVALSMLQCAADPIASSVASSRSIRLEVADTGCGIAAALLPRLFEPFFTTTADEGGAGLGLAVARSIVVEHGGAITVESVEGEGSRFVVTLPIRRVTDGPAGADTEPPPGRPEPSVSGPA